MIEKIKRYENIIQNDKSWESFTADIDIKLIFYSKRVICKVTLRYIILFKKNTIMNFFFINSISMMKISMGEKKKLL